MGILDSSSVCERWKQLSGSRESVPEKQPRISAVGPLVGERSICIRASAALGLRDLGPWQLLAVTVGAVVGASIYLRPALVAQQLHEPGPILAVWVIAGALSLTGALCYAQSPPFGRQLVENMSILGRRSANLRRFCSDGCALQSELRLRLRRPLQWSCSSPISFR